MYQASDCRYEKMGGRKETVARRWYMKWETL